MELDLDLHFLPAWAQSVAEWAPFRSMLAFPVELAIGMIPDRSDALAALGRQWAWAVVVVIGALAVWRAGIRRYEAFGA